MDIDWSKLFQAQRTLDERIMKEHQLSGDFFSERLLALQVEVGELANETRCFKYWSLKPPADRNVILEEYVDGLHFILSLGLSLDFETIQPTFPKEESPIVEQFLQVFDRIAALKANQTVESYTELFSYYLRLGAGLGFNAKDIQQAYFKKNKINHQRQEEGY